MGRNYLYFINAVSAAGIFAIHITKNNVPWYMTAMLCLNIAFLSILSFIHDWKERDTDDKIEALEKELQELKKKESENG